MYFKQKWRIAVWALSGIVGLLIVLLPSLLNLYRPQGPYLIPLSQKVNNTMAFGLVIALVFPAIVELNNFRWGGQVDKNISRLLEDITEAVQSGVTLPRAIEEASKRDYGPISKELEHTASMLILGSSWEDSLTSLAQRLRRPSALRLSNLLIEVHHTGGKAVEALAASVDLFSSLDEYREEQHRSLRPYVITIYMAAIIFLIIAYMVLHQFLAPIYGITTSTMKETGLLTNILDVNYYNSILFWASIIESIFAGLIAGKMGDRALPAGLHHSVILCMITIIFFNVSSL